MMYFEDPWILPSPSDSVEGIKHAGMEKPLSAAKISYQAIQMATTDPNPTPLQMEEVDDLLMPIWEVNSSHSPDCLEMVLSLR
jgi:hypothetical protein